jgi:hypothetical protein
MSEGGTFVTLAVQLSNVVRWSSLDQLKMQGCKACGALQICG